MMPGRVRASGSVGGEQRLAQRPKLFLTKRPGYRSSREKHVESVKATLDDMQVARHAALIETMCVGHALVVEHVVGGHSDPGWRQSAQIAAAARCGVVDNARFPGLMAQYQRHVCTCPLGVYRRAGE